ncbi:RNA polymerase II transcription factor-like protein [Ophiobolus disseminans]|uniref:RNA polymerase II transcription factor-like protein n=1 Tax=Ophiobolus disseminans TaxID=1469910 RepID=A0A6A7ACP5_9PLEO|nr:RNA polymerase II transcription factor-like protein [Ophiobolus disseminans]
MSTAAASYRKQDGTVSVSADGKAVSWTSSSGAIPPLSIIIADIGNLQQTPATAAKASIKIVVPDSAPQPGSYTLQFTSSAARDDQQTITGLLRKWIEASKTQAAPTAAPTGTNGDGASAAIALAQTVAVAAKGSDDSYDDAKLLSDLELQMSLLNTNPSLRQRFDRALAEKPDTVSLGQFSNQFWTTRVHMLRSHVTEKTQATGTYNVLSVIKSKTVNGALTLSLTKEQIELLFRQHPIVQKAYNENVPQLNETDFWERFFHSRLMKKLKGERIREQDVLDPKLDKYLQYDEAIENSDQFIDSLPLFINIEGNEQNHSQKQGNRPDFTMTPSNYDKAPILRVLNRMSEKMLKDVPYSDGDRHAPVGVDEQTYKELQLRDLQRADDDNRVVLRVQDQSRFFSAGQSVQSSTSAATYTKRTPSQALAILHRDFEAISANQSKAAGVDLQTTLGINDDSSSDEENATSKIRKVGGKSSRSAATVQIVSAIKKRHLHDDDYSSSKAMPTSEQAKKLAISEAALDNLTITHNTTIEFLHYFWAVFHSGDSDRANEVAKLIETLDKSLDRIKAVADVAEADRSIQLDRYRKEVESYNQRSGKKRKFDPQNIKGGARAVNQVVEPLLRAINAARNQYAEALQEQMSQVSVGKGL